MKFTKNEMIPHQPWINVRTRNDRARFIPCSRHSAALECAVWRTKTKPTCRRTGIATAGRREHTTQPVPPTACALLGALATAARGWVIASAGRVGRSGRRGNAAGRGKSAGSITYNHRRHRRCTEGAFLGSERCRAVLALERSTPPRMPGPAPRRKCGGQTRTSDADLQIWACPNDARMVLWSARGRDRDPAGLCLMAVGKLIALDRDESMNSVRLYRLLSG